MISDQYYTIKEAGESRYTEKMSRFLSFALPVTTAEEARALVKQYQNEYHDARHVCWAYMIGPERMEWQLNDNGEPSGTAGKPILGQINSNELTNVLVVVVRYFGGIKLGTPGLIAAYREAARLALEAAGRKEMTQMALLHLTFGYTTMEGVMRIVKSEGLEIKARNFDNVCTLDVEVPQSKVDEIENKLGGIGGVGVEKKF